MRKEVCSKATYIHKYGLFTLGVIASLVIIFMTILNWHNSRLIGSIIFLTLLSCYLINYSAKIRYIELDENFMYIKRGNEEIRISKDVFLKARLRYFDKYNAIEISFSCKTEVGKKIIIFPLNERSSFLEHSLVNELAEWSKTDKIKE